MKIKCCKDCVAPKRHPGCHGVCPEYLYEKALWEEEKKVIREEHRRFSELYEQRSEGVRKHLNIEDDNLHRKDKNLSFRY
jgi:hypothetical protein